VRGVDDAPLTDAERAEVTANLGLVHHVVKRRFGHLRGSDREDALQDGTFGLIRAVRSYDPAKGALSTHAVLWIAKSIRDGRGQLEGVNYRRAVTQGAPLPALRSLDAPLNDDGDGDTVADVVSDRDAPDFTEGVVSRIDAAVAAPLIRRAIGSSRAADHLRPTSEVARRDDIGEPAVRKRRRREAAIAASALRDAA
jgi:DNA-directed RNA polymerase sigma subunit (sigma70/sigma32)